MSNLVKGMNIIIMDILIIYQLYTAWSAYQWYRTIQATIGWSIYISVTALADESLQPNLSDVIMKLTVSLLSNTVI